MRILIAASALVLLLAGCGGDDSGGGQSAVNSEEQAGGVPACSDLVGESMPEGFEGCITDGELQIAGVYDDCEDGRVFITAGPVFGFVGEEVAMSDGPGGLDDAEVLAGWEQCYPSQAGAFD